VIFGHNTDSNGSGKTSEILNKVNPAFFNAAEDQLNDHIVDRVLISECRIHLCSGFSDVFPEPFEIRVVTENHGATIF